MKLCPFSPKLPGPRTYDNGVKTAIFLREIKYFTNIFFAQKIRNLHNILKPAAPTSLETNAKAIPIKIIIGVLILEFCFQL